MLQGVLDQLLGGDIDHVVVAVDNVPQLGLHALRDQLRRGFPIKPVKLAVDQAFQVLHRVFNLWRVEVPGQRPNPVAHIGNEIRVFDHDLPGFFFSKVGELRQHLVGGAEVEGVGPITVVEALGGQENVPEDLVLGVQEVDVSRSADGFFQFFAQPDNCAVEVPQLLLGLDGPVF